MRSRATGTATVCAPRVHRELDTWDFYRPLSSQCAWRMRLPPWVNLADPAVPAVDMLSLPAVLLTLRLNAASLRKNFPRIARLEHPARRTDRRVDGVAH